MSRGPAAKSEPSEAATPALQSPDGYGRGGAAAPQYGVLSQKQAKTVAAAPKPAPALPPPVMSSAPPAAAAPAANLDTPARNEAADKKALVSKAAPAPAPEEKTQVAMAEPPAQAGTAEQLEARAQEARRAGNYPLAAGLYRKAAALHRQAPADKSSSASAQAAWDLAHAVECLAAAGMFDEARQIRDELGRDYPSESTAFAASRRALRSAALPAAAAAPAEPPPPASKAKQAAPASEGVSY
jgi:Meckel syndrome type 1 protein